jgi:hypothetical protein
VIKSRDERTGCLGNQSYATEAEFIIAAQDLLGSTKRLLLAALPNGMVLDEQSLRTLISR